MQYLEKPHQISQSIDTKTQDTDDVLVRPRSKSIDPYDLSTKNTPIHKQRKSLRAVKVSSHNDDKVKATHTTSLAVPTHSKVHEENDDKVKVIHTTSLVVPTQNKVHEIFGRGTEKHNKEVDLKDVYDLINKMYKDILFLKTEMGLIKEELLVMKNVNIK